VGVGARVRRLRLQRPVEPALQMAFQRAELAEQMVMVGLQEQPQIMVAEEQDG